MKVETQIRDLKPQTRFVIFGEAYVLLTKLESAARVQSLKTEHVHLPNGREFDRKRKPIYISLGAIVEEVLE